MLFLRGALRLICVTPERKLTPHRELHLWPPLQRWASTHANRSNARRRLKTLPSIGRSKRWSFFKKPKISVAPSISMFQKVYCRFYVIDFYPSKLFSNDCAFYRDFRPSIIKFFDCKPSIFYICGMKMRKTTDSA
jgi:hypothetical protein